jgi:hypothetical protein
MVSGHFGWKEKNMKSGMKSGFGVCTHTSPRPAMMNAPGVERTDKEHHTCTFISGRTEEYEHARKYKKVNQKPSCKPVNEKVVLLN